MFRFPTSLSFRVRLVGLIVRSMLGKFFGALQCHLMVDDFGRYNALFAADRTGHDNRAQVLCIELACWAHIRHKFFNLYKASQSPMAMDALKRIALL